MNFHTIVIRNLFQRPTRSILTLAGIAVGIAAFVALTSLAWGFERSWEKVYAARGTDLVITKVTSQNPIPTTFPQEVADSLPPSEAVEDVAGLLSDLMSVEEAPAVLVFGWEPESYLWSHLRFVEGGWLTSQQGERKAALGTIAAEMLKKKVGDSLQLDLFEYKVAAIFQSDSLMENGAIILDLPNLQEVLECPGEVNFLNVKLKPNVSPQATKAFQKEVADQFGGYKVLAAGEMAQNNTGIQLAKAMSWATSAIAITVGAFAIMNTILMSVFERLHEIGILLAVGWKKRRIWTMIVLESMTLSAVGGLVGIVSGLAAVRALEAAPWLAGKIEPVMSPGLIAIALAIAVSLGALGGLYPAYRGSRCNPCEALRSL